MATAAAEREEMQIDGKKIGVLRISSDENFPSI